MSGPQRLQRILAAAGFGSRRQCEELIEAGRVHVDNEIVTKLGVVVDSEVAKIRVDGEPLRRQKLVYYAVNKPVGVVTTNSDPQGRPRVVDLVPPTERVFPVGRLDRSSEGLILLTNDGDLAQRLAHPKFGIQKVYRVTVAGKVDVETMKKMREGIYIAEGHVRVDGAKVLKARPRATEMEITLREGKNREIRRILARLGHKVQTLRRIAVGPLRLGDTPPGAYRPLTRDEVQKLQTIAAAAKPEALAGRKPPIKKGGTKKNATKRSGPDSKSSTTSRRPAKKGPIEKGLAKNDGIIIRVNRDEVGGAVIGGDPPPKRAKAAEGKRKRASSDVRTSTDRSVNKRTTGTRKATGSTRTAGNKKRKRP